MVRPSACGRSSRRTSPRPECRGFRGRSGRGRQPRIARAPPRRRVCRRASPPSIAAAQPRSRRAAAYAAAHRQGAAAARCRASPPPAAAHRRRGAAPASIGPPHVTPGAAPTAMQPPAAHGRPVHSAEPHRGTLIRRRAIREPQPRTLSSAGGTGRSSRKQGILRTVPPLAMGPLPLPMGSRTAVTTRPRTDRVSRRRSIAGRRSTARRPTPGIVYSSPTTPRWRSTSRPP